MENASAYRQVVSLLRSLIGTPAVYCIQPLLLLLLSQLNELDVALLKSRSCCKPGSFHFISNGDVQPSIKCLVISDLWETLAALDRDLGIRRIQSPMALEDAAVAKYHGALRYLSFTVKGLLDLATPSRVPGMGANTEEASVDQSLQSFLHRFFCGLQPALEPLFSPRAELSEEYSDAGKFILRKLKRAFDAALLIHGEVIWRIKHTFYWLSKAEDMREELYDFDLIPNYTFRGSAEKLPPNIKALVALVKAAWLIMPVPLLDNFHSVPLELKVVVYYLREEAVRAIGSLYESRTPPYIDDYDILENVRIWELTMPGDAVPNHTGYNITSPETLREVTRDFSFSEHSTDFQLRINPQTTRPVIRRKPHPMEDSSARNLPVEYRSNIQGGKSQVPCALDLSSRERVEPKIYLAFPSSHKSEEGSPSQRPESIVNHTVEARVSTAPRLPPQSLSITNKQQVPSSSRNIDSRNNEEIFPSQGVSGFVSGSERDNTDSRLAELENTERPRPRLTTPPRLTTIARGLTRDISANTESTREAVNELEFFNVETANRQNLRGDPFTRIFTRDCHSLEDDQYKLSEVRVFKDRSTLRGEYIRLWISHKNGTFEVEVNLRNAELVPVYAFKFDRQSNAAVLKLRDHRSDSDPRAGFKFELSTDESTSELYGFKSLLLGAFFEKDYPVAQVSITPRKGPPVCAALTRFQFWKEAPPTFDMHVDKSMWSMTNAPLTKTFRGDSGNFITDFSHDCLFPTKIFFYVMQTVYVLIISDRFVIQPPKNSARKNNTVDILPNKKEGMRSIRLGVLPGTEDRLAGIPLDQTGIRYSNQDAKGCFQDYKSITIQFHLERDRIDFLNDIERYRQDWKKQCEPFQKFRAMQRHTVRRTEYSIRLRGDSP